MLLGEVFDGAPRNSISWQISNVKIDLDSKMTVSLADIANEIKKSYELEEIYCYQKLVFLAMMKLLCTKIVEHFKQNTDVPSKTRDTFNTFSSEIMYHFKNLAPDVIERFTVLATNPDKVNFVIFLLLAVMRNPSGRGPSIP